MLAAGEQVEARRPIVRVEPLGVDLEVQPGETIIEAAWRLGYHWPTVCFGQAECTVCFVDVLSGDEHLEHIGDEERDALDHRLPRSTRRNFRQVRLACRAKPIGDVTVRKNGVRPPPST